jgi:hypothetical protein
MCVMGQVASSRGSKPQRPHPPKATDDEIYADDGTHRSTRRIERKNRTQDQESEVSMRDHGLQVSSNKAQHAPRTRRRDEDERQQGSRRTKVRFSQMHVFNCGAELIFDLRDKFTCCQWAAASMQELQFLCYPHNNSLLPGCRSGPRGELERRDEGGEDEPPLAGFLEHRRERERERMPPPPLRSVSSPRTSPLSLVQSSSGGFFLKIFYASSSHLLASSVMGKEFGARCVGPAIAANFLVVLLISTPSVHIKVAI